MIKRYSELQEDYHGQHRAPMKEGNAPLWDVTQNGIYPEDIYSPKAVSYYGDRSTEYSDAESIQIIQSARNKPNMKIKIYRAIPKVLSNEEKIAQYENDKRYILKTGKLPPRVTNWANKSEYYDFVSNEIERLKKLPVENAEKIEINPGDWVSINRQYVVAHGKGNLKKSYRILTKTVFAKDLFTDGNSIHEWGYDPQRVR